MFFDDLREPYNEGNDAGKLILRLGIGALTLWQGLSLLQSPPAMAAAIEGFELLYLPAAAAWAAVLIGQVLAPSMLIAGLLTRLAGVLILLHVLIASALGAALAGGASADLLRAGLIYAAGALAIAFLGSGRFALLRD